MFAARFSVATLVIIVALIVGHLWLPAFRSRGRHSRVAGRRTIVTILPGIAVTLVLWLVGGTAFGMYLDSFARNYVSTYAGLATGMIVLVFLYMLAAIFIFGAELNAAIMVLDGRRQTVTNPPHASGASSRFRTALLPIYSSQTNHQSAATRPAAGDTQRLLSR